MKTTQNSSTGADLSPQNHKPDMTLQRILLAYFNGKPLGITSYLTGEESLEQAHDEVLADLMMAQRQLDQFREQLLLLMSPGKLPAQKGKKGLVKTHQIGNLMSIIMLAQDELKREINQFLKADKAHDQT